ncbi:MAG TPA: DUF1295 domain-containing protein [Longilinea sp.]|nr:DUF1295 domain-containing protein [Longilinea sp.]
MNFFDSYLMVGLVILIYMTILWIASLILKNSSIVDIFWGLGFAVINWFTFFFVSGDSVAPKLLLSAIVTFWGLRLSIHILTRNAGKPEDFRYAKWRQESGNNWWWQSFFRVFLLQGILMWIISVPLVAVQSSPRNNNLNWLDGVALVLWLIGFFFEAVGDLQLARFRANPANKGQVLDTGVWQFTRHPNYFGDSAQWWGFYLIALSTGAWWTIFSPVLMTFLLIFVSGVALLEKSMKQKPQYAVYMATTSPFIPWLPKKND